MKEIEVKGQKRTDLGKKAAKAMRKEGLIPCNLYGEAKNADGAPEALSIACPMSELRKIVYTPHIYVIKLVIDGEERTAILKELQFHPVTDALLTLTSTRLTTRSLSQWASLSSSMVWHRVCAMVAV